MFGFGHVLDLALQPLSSGVGIATPGLESEPGFVMVQVDVNQAF